MRGDLGSLSEASRRGGSSDLAAIFNDSLFRPRKLLRYTLGSCEPIGSGATPIVAEVAGRVCFGSEQNPAHVDVAVQRWQDLTGETAILESGEQSLNALNSGEAPPVDAEMQT